MILMEKSKIHILIELQIYKTVITASKFERVNEWIDENFEMETVFSLILDIDEGAALHLR